MSVIRKIRHLLALARGGGGGNESSNAMAAARALAEKYNVNWQSVIQEEEYRDEVAERVISSFDGGRLHEWELLALNFVQRVRPSLSCAVDDRAIKIMARHNLEATEGIELYLLVRWCVMQEALDCVRKTFDVATSVILARVEFGLAAYGILGAWHDEWSDEIERHAGRVRTKHLALFIEPTHAARIRERTQRDSSFSSPPSSTFSKEPKAGSPAEPPTQGAPTLDVLPKPDEPPETPAQVSARKHQRDQSRSDAIRAAIVEAAERLRAKDLRNYWHAKGYEYHRRNTQYELSRTRSSNSSFR